ncbi:MAG TPA: hypothetical protein VN673_05100 [Clostridia bacterium]|nr:hypothetical protein [Clostridia bacterium]
MKSACDPIIWVVGVLGGILGIAYIVVRPHVDNAVEKALLSPKMLAEIASRVRPYAQVDVSPSLRHGMVWYDGGAAQFIDGTALQLSSSSRAILTLNLNRFQPIAPFVRPLSPAIYVHSFWPTNKFDWAYDVRSGLETVETDEIANAQMGDLSTNGHYAFFVELLAQ